MARSSNLFFALWFFIIAVSTIDGYLVFRHRSYMLSFEKNPVGIFLLWLNGGQVWYLLAAKLFGTIIVCGTLLTLRHFNSRLGFIVTAALAIIQLVVVVALATL